jgi:malonyl-CoA/methylmalonyl-CoA synthetase
MMFGEVETMPDDRKPETIPLIARAALHPRRIAVIDDEGQHTYQQLLDSSARVASCLLSGRGDLNEARVAFLVAPGFDYAATQWGIWRAGGVAVPLAVMHPPAELAYTIDDSQAATVIAGEEFAAAAEPIAQQRGLRFLGTQQALSAAVASLPTVISERRAMMLYTSGTTGKPKGAVTTHQIIAAQIESLVEAWQWTSADRILHVLPLHHIHGIINVLGCALWSGATCEMLARFDAEEVWRRISNSHDLTLFMAVPTIYAKLIAAWESASPGEQQAMTAGCGRLRLMVSGSAALPVPTLERWRSISGHTLLERYGMTEIGMGLSNPLVGERIPGCVGAPLPHVEVRLANESGQTIEDESPGEIQVRGPTVFKEYWQRPEATQAAFTADGWFKTGDIAQRTAGVYRILGRDSVDIIKTGGYKVSALEIEEVLLAHEAIAQCAVVGIEDSEWGQRVSVAVVLKPARRLELDELRRWAKERLAPYKIPSRMIALDELPRNALGKVTKPQVAKLFEQ